MTMSNQGMSGTSGRFPLDNLTYDLITIIYEKSKGLEAYDKYLRDAQGNQEISRLLQQIRQQDEQHIEQLRQHLGHMLATQGGMQSREVGGTMGSTSGSMGSTSGTTMGEMGAREGMERS